MRDMKKRDKSGINDTLEPFANMIAELEENRLDEYIRAEKDMIN